MNCRGCFFLSARATFCGPLDKQESASYFQFKMKKSSVFGDVTVPVEISSLSEKQKEEKVHMIFFGPTKPRPLDGLPWAYTCLADGCGKELVIKSQHDNRLHARLAHVKSKHPNWPQLLLADCMRDASHPIVDPVAQLALDLQLPSGLSRKDQEAMSVFCAFTKNNIAFSAIECPSMRKLLRCTYTMSAEYVRDAGKRFAQTVLERISNDLPSQFGLLFDSWSALSNHYIAVYVVYEHDGSPMYALLGLRPLLVVREGEDHESAPNSPEPYTFDDVVDDIDRIRLSSDFSADEHLRSLLDMPNSVESTCIPKADTAAYHHSITAILQQYGRTWDNIAFLVSDNAPVNRSLADFVNKPLIGCHAHLLNLAVKRYVNDNRKHVDAVQKLCSKIARSKGLRLACKSLYGFVPSLAVETRWRSTFEMIASYLRIHDDRLYTAHPELNSAKLSAASNRIVVRMHEYFSMHIQPAFAALDQEHCSISEARDHFDRLLGVSHLKPYMKEYLSTASMPLTLKSKVFVNAIDKINTVDEFSMTEEESASVSCFLLPTKDALQNSTRRRSLPSSRYVNVSWIPCTTSIVERTFSILRFILPYYRHAISDATLESQIMLRIFTSKLPIFKKVLQQNNDTDVNDTDSIDLESLDDSFGGHMAPSEASENNTN